MARVFKECTPETNFVLFSVIFENDLYSRILHIITSGIRTKPHITYIKLEEKMMSVFSNLMGFLASKAKFVTLS